MNLTFITESIRYKFFTAIALVLLAGTVALSVVIAVHEGLNQQALLSEKGDGLARYIAKLCIDPLVMGDTIQLDSIVNEAHYDKDILYTIILDKTGAVRTSQFASINYTSPRITPLKGSLHQFYDLQRIIEYIQSAESSINVSSPVITGTETIGMVVVCLSTHNIINNILSTVAFIIGLNIVIALILALTLFSVSRRIIFNPITRLADASRQLARGDLSTRLTIRAVGEMQLLIESFNQMAKDLEQTTVSKDSLNAVNEQLAATNSALQLEIEQRKQAQEEAGWLTDDLQRQKTALEDANRELESFSYSVSHDLRAPLRHINGFTTLLSEDYRDQLDDTGKNYLDRICAASNRMGNLIEDLLRFARISRSEMNIVDVNLSRCAQEIARMLHESEPGNTTRIEIAEGLTARCDESLMEMVLQNLIGNAWKYSSGKTDAVISVGMIQEGGAEIFFVKDNGVGFDMAYKEKLFRVFERLHGKEFEGTGIGLATVQRIIERHGGRIWAEGFVGLGATFYFTLE